METVGGRQKEGKVQPHTCYLPDRQDLVFPYAGEERLKTEG